MPLRHSYPLAEFNESPDQMKTPVYMLGLGVALLKQFFGTEDRIALEKSQYLWKENQEQSQIYIGHQDNLDYQVIGKRPAIIALLNDTTYPQEVIGDNLAVFEATGARAFLDHAVSSWTFLCFSDKAIEALGLAGEVKYFFQTYRQFLAPAYSVQKIRVVQLGRYEKQKDYKDMYACPVTVAFDVFDNFEVQPEALRISAINLQLVPE